MGGSLAFSNIAREEGRRPSSNLVADIIFTLLGDSE